MHMILIHIPSRCSCKNFKWIRMFFLLVWNLFNCKYAWCMALVLIYILHQLVLLHFRIEDLNSCMCTVIFSFSTFFTFFKVDVARVKKNWKLLHSKYFQAKNTIKIWYLLRLYIIMCEMLSTNLEAINVMVLGEDY